MCIVMHSQEDGKPGEGNTDGDEGEDESMTRSIREVRDQHREGEGARPGRYAVELRLGCGVVECLDDGRREVGLAVGGYDESKVHESAEEYLV